MNVSRKDLNEAFQLFLGEGYTPKNTMEFENAYLQQFNAALTSAAEGHFQKGQKTMPFKIAGPQGDLKGKIEIKVSNHATAKGFDPSKPNCGEASVIFHITTYSTGKGSIGPKLFSGKGNANKVRFVVTKDSKGKMHYFANEKDTKILLNAVMDEYFSELG